MFITNTKTGKLVNIPTSWFKKDGTIKKDKKAEYLAILASLKEV